jgi:lipoprotein NlpD
MGHFKITVALMGMSILAGCVPPNADTVRRKAPPVPPLADPVFDTGDHEKPVWEARPATVGPTDVKEEQYVVQAGDTLTAIGNRTGAGVDTIATANGLVPPYAIRIGQTLNIPGGRYHNVAAGESGIAIARAYAVPWAEIVALNGLQEPYSLRVGQRLKLPMVRTESIAAAPDVRSDIDARAAAFKLNIDDIITGGEPALEPQQSASGPVPPQGRPQPANTAVVAPSSFSGRFTWPLRGPINARFGATGTAERNDGIEIGSPVGTPIKAAGDGVVAFVGTGVAGYGGLVLIKHGGGWITAYGRAGDATVRRGQSVKQGQIIGHIGDFGNTGAPQLHFQIRQGRAPVDPVKYLPTSA